MIFQEKKEKLKELVQNNEEISIDKYYSTLEEIGDYESNYKDYMTTAPINVDIELSRLSNSDYELCTAHLTMLLREDYLSKIRGFYDSDLIKILVGIRRCGKSVILNQIIEELKGKRKIDEEHIIFINFEFI